jgi:hypothetical protein
MTITWPKAWMALRPFVITLPDNESQAFVCLREETSVDGLRMLHVLDGFGDESMTIPVQAGLPAPARPFSRESPCG